MAQRYVEEVFTDDQITVISDVEYGVNMSVFAQIFVPGVDFPIPDTLLADIWMPDPTIDTETERPIIVLNSTNLVPPFIIDCFGEKADDMRRYIASEMAKRGFVVMSVNTRSGVNLFAPTNDAFLASLVDWANRQHIDVRTAAAFIQRDIAESGNTYGVNTDQFILWSPVIGNTAKALYTSDPSEFESANYFVLDANDSLVNVVNLELSGGIFGQEIGMDANGNISNVPNHVDFIEPAPFDLLLHSHGSVIDTFSVQSNEPPSIMFINTNTIDATIDIAPTFLPATGEFCCNNFTGQVMQRQIVQAGNNDIWNGIEFSDPVANTRAIYPLDPSVGEIEGLLAISGPEGNTAPWLFWDEATCIAIGTASGNPALNDMNLNGFPGMTPELGMATLDTIIRFWTPRACVLFGWDCGDAVVSTTSTENVSAAASILNVSPNPSNGYFTFESSPAFPMERIQIFNVSGALMYETVVANTQFTLNDVDLSGGMYFAKIRFEDGIATKKIIVEK